jgi:DMSO reductase anchor subunit
VLVVALFFERVRGIAIFTDAPIRRHAAALLLAAFIPATFFVWTTTDHFQAKSVMKWHSGWAQDSTEFAAPFFRLGPKDFGSSTSFGLLLQKTWNGVIAPFFQFWLPNFGLWVPLVLVLVGLCFWRIWKGKWRWGDTPPAGIAFILAAVVIFGVGYFVQTAPWEWDNLKLMIWGYFIILPFLWSDLVGRWVFPERAVTCLLLFGSGFVTLLGGLTAGHPGFGLIERARLDHIGTVLRPLPMDARFATWPTFNHPILLQGRKAVLGYPGHLWTEGFDYGKTNDKLTALMNGAANWRDIAKELGVRYIFWGQDEKANYQSSTRPWEATAFLVGTGDWGAIYDLDKPAPHN